MTLMGCRGSEAVKLLVALAVSSGSGSFLGSLFGLLHVECAALKELLHNRRLAHLRGEVERRAPANEARGHARAGIN